jgi:hypothetical protein
MSSIESAPATIPATSTVTFHRCAGTSIPCECSSVSMSTVDRLQRLRQRSNRQKASRSDGNARSRRPKAPHQHWRPFLAQPHGRGLRSRSGAPCRGVDQLPVGQQWRQMFRGHREVVGGFDLNHRLQGPFHEFRTSFLADNRHGQAQRPDHRRGVGRSALTVFEAEPRCV